MPGTPPPAPPAHVPKSTTPALRMCVDCGGSFPASQIMEHTGQLVCYDCFHKRKPVVLKYPKKRSKKRKLLRWLLLLAALGGGAWAVWRFVL